MFCWKARQRLVFLFGRSFGLPHTFSPNHRSDNMRRQETAAISTDDQLKRIYNGGNRLAQQVISCCEALPAPSRVGSLVPNESLVTLTKLEAVTKLH